MANYFQPRRRIVVCNEYLLWFIILSNLSNIDVYSFDKFLETVDLPSDVSWEVRQNLGIINFQTPVKNGNIILCYRNLVRH